MEKITYLGFKNCYRLANNDWQLIVTTEVGPRILFYGRVGGTNHFGEFPEAGEETEYGLWKAYGGHRLWVAPESKPFSYAPDNEPVEARNEGDFCLRVVQKTDAAGIDKEMSVSLDPLSSAVQVSHKVTNRNTAPREVAVWALTIFRDGEAVAPLEHYRSHDDALLPSQPLVLWPFTNLSDSRIKLGDGWLRLGSDSAMKEPQKLGLANRRRWAAHIGGDELFVKRFNYSAGAKYPDFGSNCEFYVAGDYMEIETLSPLSRLQQGESVEHDECWELHPLESGGSKSLLDTLNRLS